MAETIDGLRWFDQILNMHSLRKSRSQKSRIFRSWPFPAVSLVMCAVFCDLHGRSVFFFITGAVFGALLARRGFVARAWGPEFFDRCSLLGVCLYKNQVSSLFRKDALQLNAAIFRVLQPRSP